MALPNDLSRTCTLIAAAQASDPNFTTDAKKNAAPRMFVRRTYYFDLPAFNANGNNVWNAANTLEQRYMKSAGRVLGANLMTSANVTANDSNYATFAIAVNDGTSPNTANSTANVALARTQATAGAPNTGNLVVGTTVPLQVNSAIARYVRGSWLAAVTTQVASGVATAACTLAVDVEEEDVDAYPV